MKVCLIALVAAALGLRLSCASDLGLSPGNLLKDYDEELPGLVSWSGVKLNKKGFAKKFQSNVKQTKSGLIIEENISSSSLSEAEAVANATTSAATQRKKGKQQRNRSRGQRQRLNKNALRFLNGKPHATDRTAAYPPLFNIASRASIAVNATCGLNGREEFCKLVDAYPHNTLRTQCGICNSQSSDAAKQHPIESVLDNSNAESWWQSPTLQYGRKFEYVTITLDLKQPYQVFLILLKAANTPRPASWILERSLDNIHYSPWQFFGLSDSDCRKRYGLPAETGKYKFSDDHEVICTTQFSKPLPLENGEIHVSLLKNRPGSLEQSERLMDFITARYIRIRFQGMHSTADADNRVDWLLDPHSLEKRSFYSLKKIWISGRLDCHGHADKTIGADSADGLLECACLHNTCGTDCGKCCPSFENKKFQNGTIDGDNSCEKCECNGHSEACTYDDFLEAGICDNCTGFTAGNNCEFCQLGYFRPDGAGPEETCQKCNCSSLGSVGHCKPEGGACVCKEGFEGEKCDVCSEGRVGQECSSCACDSKGTVPSSGCDNCSCKMYVEGENCSQCALGYFGLSAKNPEGCTKCFCSGVGLSCKSATIEASAYHSLNGWKVTDISRSLFVYPTLDLETGKLIFGMYDFDGVESVYWLAPEGYVGKKLTSYGATIKLQVEWIVIRGDTSGKPTSGPGIILIGKNGMKIAYGDQEFSGAEAEIDIPLTEEGWYHVPSEVKDIVLRSKRTEYHGDPVSRVQFMSVLSQIDDVLVRATYHTDQAESVLVGVTLNSGWNATLSRTDTSLIEECACPPGYRGLSCESCDFGFIRVYENSADHNLVAKCMPCPCNGHTDSCDLDTGACGECLHNTFGERCERCKVGFYGNPMHGTPSDCNRCACPLLEDSNNFSPSCQLRKLNLLLDGNSFGEDDNSEYVCTQCPEGYVGDHCEMCDDGYYGNPTVLGSKCVQCECSGGPCDVETGECITCHGNTEGWHCERCKLGYWGDPSIGCEPCECYEQGAEGNVCDSVDGQCLCKPRFTGQKCDECEIGYADVDKLCPPCGCNANGSFDEICDPSSGECSCRDGVAGLKCDACKDEFFGLSAMGCEECQCHPIGAIARNCDLRTGQCPCQPKVSGRRCEKCQSGNWNLTTSGCVGCNCDAIGSRGSDCNQWTGQCDCKLGVGGRQCDECQEGFYGFSNNGCLRCDPCPSAGHVCDPLNGRCVCPPSSKGLDCTQCMPGTWGWRKVVGCSGCDCDMVGSIGQMCNAVSGQCTCREGYAGRRCDMCAVGYFGYPECRRCNCDASGSFSNGDGLLIPCDGNGQCPCKPLVTGTKCDTCVQSTFGLATSNPEGCTRCFCFGRSQECVQSDWSWGHIIMPGSRNLSVQYVQPANIPQGEYEYIVVVQMEGSKSYHEDAEISLMNSLNLIPSSTGNVSIGAYTSFYYPLYFQLSPQFYGDKTSSYGGYLRFSLLSDGCSIPLNSQILEKFPLVQIHAHNRLVLDFFEKGPIEVAKNSSYTVPLHESFWRNHQSGQAIDRTGMMTALQNIRHIFLRGTTWADFTEVVIHNVHMDTAVYVHGSTNMIARGVEKCNCPHRYDGLSCQDPGEGFYRWRNSTQDKNVFLEDMIGRSIPCECNGRSDVCDRETGVCLKCRENTGGDHCERCAEGFYGDANYGTCRACPCPETSKNFAKGCTVWKGEVSCICRQGYTGPLCDHCRTGYYGMPWAVNGTCEPCSCNIDGAISDECGEESGQCSCRPGVTGVKCDKCIAERHILDDRRCRICDNCTLTLLDYVDLIANKLRRAVIHLDLTGIPAPWAMVDSYETQINKVDDRLQDFIETKREIRSYDDSGIEKLFSYSENAMFQWRKLETTAFKRAPLIEEFKSEANTIFIDVGGVRADIVQTIAALKNYGTQAHHLSLPTALEEAKFFWNEIRYHDQMLSELKAGLQCGWDNLYLYGNASDAAFDQRGNLEMFWRDLNQTRHRVSDLKFHTDHICEMQTETDDINEHVLNMKNYLVEDFGKIREVEAELKWELDHNLIEDTYDRLDGIRGNLERMVSQSDSIADLRSNLNETLYNREELFREVRKHWLPKAWKWANRLMERSDEYARQFEPTKDGARVALLASSAHQNISDAIDAARRASVEANQAVFDAREKLYPTNGESVIEKSKLSLAKSRLLQKEALREMDKSDSMKSKIKVHEDSVEKIKNRILDAGYRTNNASFLLTTIDTESARRMAEESIEMATEISKQMNEQKSFAVKTQSDMSKLRQKIAILEPDWDTKLGMAEENISETLSNIRIANISLHNVEEQEYRAHEKFQVWNDTVSRQLQELKDKIAKARHAAEAIKVSLESLTPKCMRSYAPFSYGLSTSNMIKMTFALSNRIGNSPLIYVQGRDGRYISLELFKRKVRLVWNLGGSTGVITHPLEVQTRDPKFDDAWYHVEANRTLNIGSLIVRRMTNLGTLGESNHVSGATDAEFTRFFRTATDQVFLGGTPNEQRRKDSQLPNGLNVVVHQVYIDNKPLGLWNFAQSEGQCGGSMLGAVESSSSSNARHFNGLGYSEVKKTRPRPYRKNLFALQMTFRTLDENALLFLAVDDKNNRSVSVTLTGGRILFRIDYGDESKLEINTTKRHNTGQWVKIEAAREFSPKRGTENGILRVNNENPITGSPTNPIKSHMLPDLSKPVYYLGGVPPGFKSGTTKAPGADYPFLGCMRDVQINGETYDPLESSSYFGVEPSCKDVVTKSGFAGNGFVELPSQSLRKRSNAGFVFRTLQNECLLLLSAYPPEVADDYDSKDQKGNYSISLVDGRLVVWVDSGRSAVKLASNHTVNDGEFHVVNLIKTGRKLELMVDDELHDAKSLSGSPTIVSMPKEAGGLYIGGAPPYPEYKSLAPTFVPLEGAIRDLVFNNKTLAFNQAVRFSNAQIGRNGPPMGIALNGLNDVLMKTEPIGKSFTATPEGCQRVGSYSYEPNAFKFGDGQNSYSQLNIPVRHLWQKNFRIEFDLRTFYPNGVIFVAPGTKEKQKHYVALLMKDGHLNFVVRGRRREELVLTAKLNNGDWHHVVIACLDRKLTMSVEIGSTDQKTSTQMKVPKKISASNIFYVGGLPDTQLKLPAELVQKIEGFKGCVRKMIVNNATQDLARPEKHLNVGQCFPKVERGSYFPGDAFAVYKKNFHVGKFLEFEMEFRTSELNGILLSVSEQVGFPALSLEIHNGNVVLSCDLGDGNPFRVESMLPSKYAICDNKWHNISALYDYEQLALRIDHHPPMVALAQPDTAGKIQTKSPLYIGGLPEIAPSGTLISRENFKGCIRNVVIRNERRDWIDMDSLHNVLLSECYVAN